LNYIRVASDDVIKGQRVNSGEQTRAPSRQLSGLNYRFSLSKIQFSYWLLLNKARRQFLNKSMNIKK